MTGGWGGYNLNEGMPGDVIQLGSVGEHGGGVKVDGGGGSLGKNGAPKLFRGVEKERRKSLSLVGNEMMLLAAKEAAVGRTDAGVRRQGKLEGVPEILV